MKRIFTYLTIAGAVLLVASCSKNLPPVFDDANAFVAFSSKTASLDESKADEDGIFSEFGDTLNIPVTLGSVAGLEASVSFTITADTLYNDDKTVKYVPKEGVNYKVLTEGGTLRFDKENRTQYITVCGIYYPEYTGDLHINIDLKTSGDIKLGTLRSCKLAICDVDHPLTFLLGNYSISTTGAVYYSTNPWSMSIYKDAKDDHKVWFFNIFGNPGWAADGTMFYGNVNDEKTKINIPFGQQAEYMYDADHGVYLYGYVGSLNDIEVEDLMDKGSMDVDIVEEGGKIKLVFDPAYGIAATVGKNDDSFLGCIGYSDGAITAVK